MEHNTIEDAWKEFHQGVLEGEGLSDEEIYSHKAAFYAGTWELMLRIMRVTASRDPLVVQTLLQDTIAEFEEYRQHATRGEFQ
jgi:hypothetical protein